MPRNSLSSGNSSLRSSHRRILLAGTSLFALVLAGGVARAGQALDSLGAKGGTSAAVAAQSAAMAAAQASAAVSQQSRVNVTRAVDALRSAQAAQAAARAAAQSAASAVPNGLGVGGLNPGGGAALSGDGKSIDLSGAANTTWQGVDSVRQTLAGTKTDVTVKQSQQKAILTWESFNVGRDTTLNFDQADSSYVALNRVTGGAVAPSQILGSVNAKGSVYVINQNGILFGGASQVNVHSLVASTAAITNDQFLNKGLYSTQTGSTYNPSFTGAGDGTGAYAGLVRVEAGAEITTNAPTSVTSGGGFVMLLGKTVENEGTLSTPKGQTLLAAGDDFIIRKGYGTDANTFSTTRGNEVAPVGAGSVTNKGLIFAQQGDITMTGHAVIQNGVMIATTSVDTRGTIHLLNSFSDTSGSVTLGSGALTQILPELDSTTTALNSKRDSLITDSTKQDNLRYELAPFDNLSTLVDRLDQGRIEIVTGGLADFQSGSLTMAQGGQITVKAAKRIFTADGAVLDVSGTSSTLAMATNQVLVDIQGNELRDSPLNRDSDVLKNEDVWIDVRNLVLVPAGTGGYASDRYYTKGGLLEVSGYLSNTGHTIGEWTAVGGTITLAAPDVVAQKGSIFNLSGGALSYAGGTIRLTNFLGIDGKVYTVSDAPADMQFVGMGDEVLVKHEHWGVTETYSHAFGLGRETTFDDPGYTVGRDAGKLVLSTPSGIFEGTIVADVFSGERQTGARPSGVTDGYKYTQNTVALPGRLVFGGYMKDTSNSVYFSGVTTNVLFGEDEAPELTPKTVWFDSKTLSSAGLGGITTYAYEGGSGGSGKGSITVAAPLTLAPGGSFDLVGDDITIAADLTARSGDVRLVAADIVKWGGKSSDGDSLVGSSGSILVDKGVTIDTRGLWTNLLLDPTSPRGLAFQDGGDVYIESGRIELREGSSIDTSSGGALLQGGKLRGGAGGDISLLTNGDLKFEATLTSHGYTRGGALRMRSGGEIHIVNDKRFIDNQITLAPAEATDRELRLATDLVIAEGGTLPLDYIYQKETIVKAGDVMPQTWSYTYPYDSPLSPSVPDNWKVPAGVTVTDARYGNTYSPGWTVVEGGRLSYIRIEAGTTLPVDLFPQGLNLGKTLVTLKTGEAAPFSITYKAGTLVPSGSVFGAAVALVNAAPELTPDFFSRGFSSYDIHGLVGVTVEAGVKLDVTMPIYSTISEDASRLPSGTDPALAFVTELPPLYFADAAKGQMIQRQGASLTLRSYDDDDSDYANMGVVKGQIIIGDDASIRVDPGQSVKAYAYRQLTLGDRAEIHAPGGNVSLISTAYHGEATGYSVWLGRDSLIDVAGRAVTALDLQGRRFGIVQKGGTVLLGSETSVLSSNLKSTSAWSDAYIILRPGAVIDASGAHALIDVYDGSTSQPTDWATDGGTISLSSRAGIYNDGTLKAAAGGANASGGTLAITLLNMPMFTINKQADYENARILTVTQDARASGLADDAKAGVKADGQVLGRAQISAEEIAQGGFDSVALLASDGTVFDGDVTLNLRRSLTLLTPRLAHMTPNDSVFLRAAYMCLGNVRYDEDPQKHTHLQPSERASAQLATGTFSVAADLIDLGQSYSSANNRNLNFFGIGADGVTPDSAGFAKATFTSSGDLRLNEIVLGGVADLTLNAAQVYGGGTLKATKTITLGRTTTTVPAMPLTFGKTIKITAPRVNQGGILRAPQGHIEIGYKDSIGNPQSFEVATFLPGSITSVGTNGLYLPYGGTVDGVNYLAGGGAYTLPSGAQSGATADPYIVTYGEQVSITKGAVIDLSGGGTLAGAGFVSGRGGSIDVLTAPLASANPANRLSAAGNSVYAIVPGIVTAPDAAYTSSASSTAIPAIGSQITIPDGAVPGLSGGTYTLLPANYALMPGGYRIEIGAETNRNGSGGALGNGSYSTIGYRGIANTTIKNSLPNQIIVTPGAAVRKYSQYNETTYDAFALKAAETQKPSVRPTLLADAKMLTLKFSNPKGRDGTPFRNEGTVFGVAGQDGLGSVVNVTVDRSTARVPTGRIEIVADDPTAGFGGQDVYGLTGISLLDSALSNLDVDTLMIGGTVYGNYGEKDVFGMAASEVFVREGAVLSAPTVLLGVYDKGTGGEGAKVVVEGGATIDTRSKGATTRDFAHGVNYNSGSSVLAVSNGPLVLTCGTGSSDACGGAIQVGKNARILSNGVITFLTNKDLTVDGGAVLGTRNLGVSGSYINIGEKTGAVVPDGLSLSAQLLDRLAHPLAGSGIPAIEALTLTASKAVNFYGTVALDTTDSATGKAQLDLVINTPGIYGYGDADDVATIRTGTFYWNGTYAVKPLAGQWGNSPKSSEAPAPIAGGAGTGSGRLDIQAGIIVLGYEPLSQAYRDAPLDRTTLGFSAVNLTAGEKVVANNAGTLAVYQSRSLNGTTPVFSGGDLSITTPLLTAESAASLGIAVGGAFRLVAPSGGASTASAAGSGAMIDIKADTVVLDTAIGLTSGKFAVTAAHDLDIGGQTTLDLAGRATAIFDKTVYSPGGTATFESTAGDITLAEGAMIDVSAVNADAGKITFTAPDAAAGLITLDGRLVGTTTANDGKEHSFARFALAAQHIGSFDALNAKLNVGGFFGARSFALKQGDLTVTDASGLKANVIEISVDGGSLTVDGLVDASGARPGTIRLAARDDLTVSGRAVLDAHGTSLWVDGYNQPIDAENRANIELTTATGLLQLASGATLNLLSPDQVARGRVSLNVPRTGETSGDVRIDASGPITIKGAKSIALNAFWTYAPTDPDGSIVQDNGGADPVGADGVVGMKQIDTRNRAFILAAYNNDLASRSLTALLRGKLAGLTAYGDAFHLRPGVEIVSSLQSGGKLKVKGNLDLSAFRYGPDVDTGISGSGEPGMLALRASDDITINGSITDGFTDPQQYSGPIVTLQSDLTLSAGFVLPVSLEVPNIFSAGSTIPDNANGYLAVLTDVVLADDLYIEPGSILGDFSDLFGGIYALDENGSEYWYYPGETIPAGATLLASGGLPSGYTLPANVFPNGISFEGTQTLAAGTTLTSDITLAAGTQVREVLVTGKGTPIWSTAQLQAPGTHSWSYRLVSGADLDSADTRRMQADSVLGDHGDFTLDDAHKYAVTIPATDFTFDSMVSFIRTGTGDIDILAGGTYSEKSLFGIYTAGTQLDTNPATGTSGKSDMAGYAVDGGGDLLIAAQGDLRRDFSVEDLEYWRVNSQYRNDIGTWLWRQAGDGITTAWGINFQPDGGNKAKVGDFMVSQIGDGFAGFGTLGGGNLTLSVGGSVVEESKARPFDFAIGATGSVSGSTVNSTGGGRLVLDVEGSLYAGSITVLRGDAVVNAGGIDDPFTPEYNASGSGGLYAPSGYFANRGPSIVLGDATASFTTRGDLSLGWTITPTAVREAKSALAGKDPNVEEYANTNTAWFSLWTDRTEIDAFSSGGNLSTDFGSVAGDFNEASEESGVIKATGAIATFAPSRISLVAPTGSILPGSFEMAPSENASLGILAGGSIFGGVSTDNISISGADPDLVANVFRPIYQVAVDGSQYIYARYPISNFPDQLIMATNVFSDAKDIPDTLFAVYQGVNNGDLSIYDMPLVAWGPDTVTQRRSGAVDPVRVYALTGDIDGFSVGQVRVALFNPSLLRYTMPLPVQVRAGRDILNYGYVSYRNKSRLGLAVNDLPGDVSVMAAGRDIYQSSMMIAGPGALSVTAGRNVYFGNSGSLTSIGALASGDNRPGADIAVTAGSGSAGPNYEGLLKYLDPANQANLELPLADQPGKLAKTYENELISWLKERFDYAAKDADDANLYFSVLTPEQQAIFLRTVYYAELKAGGREYNDPSSKRYQSYLRGRQAIEALFPEGRSYDGDVTLFSGTRKDASGKIIELNKKSYLFDAGIQTQFGGDISVLVPGGHMTVGVEGVLPGSTAGLLTQGEGDINLYSEGSISLGLSRIMTTFGGNILAWSAKGDINAGRGAKTTVIYTPPKRVYDAYGNITLSPTVPSSGAGIATLNPIPEVPPGDIDLIAPLGTVDAGEAGIRVSGNVNIAALQVLNAANIQVQGTSSGIPVAAAGPNVGALTAASNTAGSAASAAEEASRSSRQTGPRVNSMPSIITIEVIGYGGGSGSEGLPPSRPPEQLSQIREQYSYYNPSSSVRYVGSGVLSEQQKQQLTPDERNQLGAL